MSTWSKNDVALVDPEKSLPEDIANEADRIRDARFYQQQFDLSPEDSFDLQPQLNKIAFGQDRLVAAPGKMFSDAFKQALATKPAMMLHGFTAYTPGKALGLDPLLDKAATYLESLKDPTVTQRIQTAEAGKLWPVGKERRWWQVEAQYLPEVINAWAANVGDQIPIMLTTWAGRMAGKALGKPLALVAGAGAAAVTAGPDPTDVVTAPAVAAITQEVVKHLGGAAPMIAIEAAGFLDDAANLQIDPDIAEKYARLYGVGSGAIEYAQQLWLLGRYSKVTKPVQERIIKTVLKHLGGSAVEGIEEVSQGGLENWLLGKAVAEMKARHPEYRGQPPATWAGAKRAGAIGAGVAFLTGLPGTGMTVAQGAEARLRQAKPETKKLLGEPSVQEVQRATEAEREEVPGAEPERPAVLPGVVGTAPEAAPVPPGEVAPAEWNAQKYINNFRAQRGRNPTSEEVNRGEDQWRREHGEIAPAAAEEKAAKAPWEMTNPEYMVYREQKAVRQGVPTPPNLQGMQREQWRFEHQENINRALAVGKAVPPEVLADYPDLQPPALAQAKEEGGGEEILGGPSGGLAWHTVLRTAMTKVAEIRPEVEWEIHQETSRRAGSYMNRLRYLREEKGVGSEEALQRAKAELKGEKTEWQRFESLDMVMPNAKEVRQAAFDDIATTDRLMVYEKINAADAFTRLWDGKVIAPYEARILKKWRPELADLIEERVKQLPITVRIFSKIEDALGLLKFGAAFDVQMRRQARWLLGRHPELYARSVVKDVEAYISAAHADKIAKEVEIDPQHKSAVEHGVVFLERAGTGMGKRPEQYISHWGEKIPIAGKIYAASMRGFVEGFNWLQQQLWNYKMAAWRREGRTITPKMLEDLAEFNNSFLGMMPAQSDWGRNARRFLTPIMWSPTLTWSRIRSPAMVLTNPTMRAETAATLASYIGSGIMMLVAVSYMARLLGRDDPIEWDVGSTDFGKVRIGNTRFDVFGDGGTYIRAFLQTVLQKKTNAAGRVRRDVGIESLKQLLRNKRAPFIDLFAQVWTGRNYYGGDAWALPDWAELKEKGGVREIVAKAGEKITEPTVGKVAYFVGRDLLAGPFLAFFVQGALEAAWNDGWPVGLMAAADEFFSGSTLSYEPSSNAKAQMLQDQVAVATHGKLWEDISPSQQERLRRSVPEINELEEEASFERLPPEEVKRAETNASAERIAKALPPVVKRELDAAHIRITGVSRAWGDFQLNDRRYREYNELVSDVLAQRLQRLIAETNWAKTRSDYKDKRLRATIKSAKEEARAKLRQQIEQGNL